MHRTFHFCLLLLLAATARGGESSDPIQVTVQVHCGNAAGSGTAIGPKLVLSCAHVLDGQSEGQPLLILKHWHDGADQYRGELLASDAGLDVALIAVPAAELEYAAPVADDPPTPQAATFCGHARGRAEILSIEGYIARGYSTRFDLVAGPDSIEGQSGGGVFDARGRFLGVVHGRPNAAPSARGGGIFTPMRHIRHWIATACQGPRCLPYLPPSLRTRPHELPHGKPQGASRGYGRVTPPPQRQQQLRPIQPPAEHEADLAAILSRLEALSQRIDSLQTQPGPQGPPGERGPAGPPGSDATIDEAALTERLMPMIDQRIEEAVARRVPHYFSIVPRRPKGN